MTTEVLLPKLGFSMNEGTLADWLVEDGGYLEARGPYRTPITPLTGSLLTRRSTFLGRLLALFVQYGAPAGACTGDKSPIGE